MTAGAHQWIESNETLQQAAMSDETFPLFVATGFARAGDSEAALRWLDQAITWGFTNHRFLSEHNRFLAPLRGDPRFEALMEKTREKERGFQA